MKHLILLLLGSFLLTACATTSQSGRKEVLENLSKSGVSPQTYNKMANGRVLAYGDILNLVQVRVPQAVIVSYLKSTKAPYRFTTAQLEQLSDAGAGSDLVNYLGKSVGYYQATQRAQTGGSKWDNHPYFNDPYYLGDAPFPFMYPPEWDDPAVLDGWF